jgi:hypothetical protein
MMAIFKQDPTAALAKTQDKLAGVRAKIAALQAKRAELLLHTMEGRSDTGHAALLSHRKRTLARQ